MAALTQDRNTPRRTGDLFSHPVAAGVRIFAGSLVLLDGSGNAIPGAVAANLHAAGMARTVADNRNGAAGELSVGVEKGLFGFATDGTITRAQLETVVYVQDDQTVTATAAGRSAAGVLKDLEGTGPTALAWVEIR